MFTFFKGASLKIARNLIEITRLKDSFALFKEKDISLTGPSELIKLVLALNACNLIATMEEEFVAREISPEDRQDTVDDYVYEGLRVQSWVTFADGAQHMDLCMGILEVAGKLRSHWEKGDPNGPGPRYYCVKDVLRRLGNEGNHDLQDALFEFTFTQHNEFIKYFHQLLTPTSPEEVQKREEIAKKPADLDDLGGPAGAWKTPGYPPI